MHFLQLLETKLRNNVHYGESQQLTIDELIFYKIVVLQNTDMSKRKTSEIQ